MGLLLLPAARAIVDVAVVAAAPVTAPAVASGVAAASAGELPAV